MSTKRLSRSVVEGGRSPNSKWERRAHNRIRRHSATQYYNNYYEDNYRDPEEPFRVYGREFSDRLSCLYRWLRAQIGRPWNDVFSDVCRTNDARSVKGWHLRDHVDQYVWRYRQITPYGLYVDDDGLLQEAIKTPHYSYLNKKDRDLKKAVIDWLSDSLILPRGGELFWFFPVSNGRWSPCHIFNCHRYSDKPHRTLAHPLYGENVPHCRTFTGYRQDMRLNRAQAAYFASLPAGIRSSIIDYCKKIMLDAVRMAKKTPRNRKDIEAWLKAIK